METSGRPPVAQVSGFESLGVCRTKGVSLSESSGEGALLTFEGAAGVASRFARMDWPCFDWVDSRALVPA